MLCYGSSTSGEIEEPANARRLPNAVEHPLVPQLVVELMGQGFRRSEALLWRIAHDLPQQVDEEGVRLRKHLLPLPLLDFGELVVVEVVVRVHVNDLGLGGRSHHLDDLDQVVDAALADEQGQPVDHLQDHAPSRPDVDHRGVLVGAEDQLRRSVAPRADVGQVRLTLPDDLGRPEIAQDGIPAFEEDVVWLDVSMADALRVDVQEPPKDLVGDELEVEGRDAFLRVLLDEAIEVGVVERHQDVQVLVLAFVGDVGPKDLHDEIAVQQPDDFEFSVVVLPVLQNSLDGHGPPRIPHPPLEHSAEGALSDHPDDFDVLVQDARNRRVEAALGFQSLVFRQNVDFLQPLLLFFPRWAFDLPGFVFVLFVFGMVGVEGPFIPPRVFLSQTKTTLI